MEKISGKRYMKAVVYTGIGEYAYSDSVKEIPTPGRG